MGEQLQARRRARGLSQENVAHAAGMSRNHYQLLEAGLSDRTKSTAANPRLSTLISLAQVLDVSVTDLVVELFGPAAERPADPSPTDGS